MDQVEWLVMKALSLKLIKGSIDEIDKVVFVEWVMPRVLGEVRGSDRQSQRSDELATTSLVTKTARDHTSVQNAARLKLPKHHNKFSPFITTFPPSYHFYHRRNRSRQWGKNLGNGGRKSTI